MKRKPKISKSVKIRKDLNGYLLYYPFPRRILMLNKVGYDILSLCNGKNTLDEIIINISKKYKIEKKDIYDDIKNFLKELEKADIVEYK